MFITLGMERLLHKYRLTHYRGESDGPQPQAGDGRQIHDYRLTDLDE
jgi:hypothetical protein